MTTSVLSLCYAQQTDKLIISSRQLVKYISLQIYQLGPLYTRTCDLAYNLKEVQFHQQHGTHTTNSLWFGGKG